MINNILEDIRLNWNKSVCLETKFERVVDYLFQPGWLTGNIDRDLWMVYNTEFTTDQVEKIVITTDSITIWLKITR